MGIVTMILIAVAAIVAAVLTAFTVVFWKKIVAWLKKMVEKIKKISFQSVLHGTKNFLKKIGKRFKKVAEFFSKLINSDRWLKQTVTSEELIDANEVPEDILKKYQSATGDTVEITVETKNEMQIVNQY